MNWKVLSAVSVLLIGQAAQAQQEAKTSQVQTVRDAIRRLSEAQASLPAGPPVLPAVAARRMVAFGKCVMSDPGAAGQILATIPGSAEERLVAAKVAKDRAGCLNTGVLKFGPAILRGVIAEGFLHRDFGSIGGPARRRVATIYSTPDRATWPNLPSNSALQLHALGACVVARVPAKVSALLASAPANDDEGRAWNELSTDLGECIDPKESVRITKLQLRGVMAEAGYRSSVVSAHSAVAQ